MSDKRTIDVYDARAEAYLDLVSRDTPDQDLRAFIDGLPKGAKVLDLGCGPGNSAAMMHNAGMEVEAWDASAQMVQLARKHDGVTVKKARFDDLTVSATFDGIWANFSLLHAPKAEMPRHLASIHHALKPGGLFHIGMKLGAGEERDKIGRMYSYFKSDELINLIKKAGFTPGTPRFGEEAGLSGEVAPFMILRAHA